MLNISGCT